MYRAPPQTRVAPSSTPLRIKPRTSFIWLSLTMGPMSGLFRGLPRVMALVRSTRRRRKVSLKLSSMRIRDPAEQTSPWLKKIPIMAHSTAPSRSASAKMMLGDFPPSSRPIFLTFAAAQRIMSCPTAVDPVKVTMLMPGWAAMALPTEPPGPRIRLTEPLGMPAFSKISNIFTVDKTQLELGLKITLFPAASAGASFQAPMRKG